MSMQQVGHAGHKRFLYATPTGADAAVCWQAAGRGGATPGWESERPRHRNTPTVVAAVGRGGRWCVRCALFPYRGDETASFCHLPPLREEEQPLLHEGRRSSYAN